MNEAETRAELIDPAIAWVVESNGEAIAPNNCQSQPDRINMAVRRDRFSEKLLNAIGQFVAISNL
jgi:hypothetical protein